MKRLQLSQIFKTYILCLILVILSSCTNEPKILSIIPKDTEAIAVVDIYSLIKKGELDNLEQFDIFKSFSKEIRNENKKVSRIFQNINEDPRITGLNFSSELLMFYVNEAQDEQYLAFSMELNNEEKFSTFIEELLDNANISFDVENEKTHKYIIVNKEVIFAWDKDKLICLSAKNRNSRKNLDFTVNSLFALKEINQITQNKDFTAFYNNKKDISVWFSANLLEGVYQYESVMRELNYDIKYEYVAAYLNFENDNISMQWKTFFNDDVKNMLEENPITNTNLNSDLLNFLPKNSLANASLSIDPMAYYNMLKLDKNFDTIENEFENEMGFTLEDFIGSLSGSTVFSLIDIKEMEYTYRNYYRENITKTQPVPIMGLAFDISNKTYIEKIINKIPDNELQKRSNYYEIELDNKFDMYIAFNVNTCFITNDKTSIKAFKDGGLNSASLFESSQISNFKNNRFYASMNLDFNSYPDIVKKEFDKELNKKERKVFDMWSNLVTSVELKQIDNYTMQLDLKTEDKTKNSLNNILSLMDKSYNSYMGL